MRLPGRLRAHFLGLLALVFACCLVGAGPLAATLDGETLTYEDLVDLIEMHDVRSIEELLPLLPANYRSEYTLMHTSRSLQQATFEYPRVIMTGPRATLVIAFTANPESNRYNTVEIIQFREDGAPAATPNPPATPPATPNPATLPRGFEFLEIVFSDLDPPEPPTFSPGNQSLCRSCHGDSHPTPNSEPTPNPDPRPNWEVYGEWPGAYGSSVDRVPAEISLGNIAKFFASPPAPCPTPNEQCVGYSSAPFSFRPMGYQEYLFEVCGDCSGCMFNCQPSCSTSQCLPGRTDVQQYLEDERDGLLQFLASYQAHPRYKWLENMEEYYAIDDDYHYAGRNNAVLSQRFSKLNFQRLVERYRGGSPVTATYSYTKRLIAFLLTRCLEDWGSSTIQRSDYLPPGFSNLVPLGFEMDMLCDSLSASTYGKCNYDPIFRALGYNTLSWPTSFFATNDLNRSLAVTAFDTRPEAAFLYWLRERDLDIGAYVEIPPTPVPPTPAICTRPEVDHEELGRTACTAEIPLVNDKADQSACIELATDARADLSQWPNPPAKVTCCVGDCDCMGTVVINELVTSVNVALGMASVNACLPVDYNISDTATVNELILAVRGSLNPPCSPPSGGGGGAPAGGGGSATLDVPNAGGSRGQSVTLNLTLSTSGGSAAAAQLDLSYVSTVFSAGNVSSSWDPAASVSNCTLGSTLDPAKHQIAVSDSPAGGSARRLRVSVLPKFSGTVQNLPTGTIASCTFQIAANAPIGTHTMFLTEPGVSDAFGAAVAATARFATVVQVCEGCNCG